MLKKKVIASSINNLTDARYFAGWMVDAFIFSIDPQSPNYLNPQEIGTFQSWVEGPEYYLELSDELYGLAEKYLVDLNCQGLCIPFSRRSSIANLDVPVIYTLEDNELADYLSLNFTEKAIVQTEKSVSEISEMVGPTSDIDLYYDIINQQISKEELLTSKLAGFNVHGSPEEKLGFKSYDELDEIFEVLQDF